MSGFKIKTKISWLAVVAVLVSLVVVILIAVWFNQPSGFGLLKNSERPKIALHPMFYEATNFSQATVAAEQVEAESNILAVVVPHHLLVGEYMAEMLKRASGREIKTVVVVGPNHENVGMNIVSSAPIFYQTPFGDLAPEENLSARFLADFGLVATPEVFINEHSVGAIAPFIKHYWPRSKIMPIVFSSYATTRDAKAVGQWLAKNLPEDSLLIVSTDFSHYLTKTAADQHDVVTAGLIEARDIEKIMRLNNDNVDSPASLATVLIFAREQGLTTNIIHNNNSFNFLAVKPVETTSYFAITFSR